MRVVRVAETIFDAERFQGYSGYKPQPNYKNIPDADELGEAAGRLCYKSWGRPNPATAENSDYIANIVKQQHFSVLEHASVTYYVSGVSRSLLTELERHRHFSFSVVSQRYVDHSLDGEFKLVHPPIFGELDISDQDELNKELTSLGYAAEAAYKFIFNFLSELGFPRKQAREAARAALPQSVATEFLITGNLRAYREMLAKRLSKTADREIRNLAKVILADLKEYAPATFQDMKVED